MQGYTYTASINELLMAIDELAHLVDQTINDMKLIGDENDEGGNGLDQLFVAAL